MVWSEREMADPAAAFEQKLPTPYLPIQFDSIARHMRQRMLYPRPGYVAGVLRIARPDRSENEPNSLLKYRRFAR